MTTEAGTWLAVAPWLAATKEGTAHLDGLGAREGAVHVAELAFRTRQLATVSDTFPAMPRTRRVSALAVSPRCTNLLLRTGIDTLDGLADLELADLQDLRNMGRLLMTELLTAIVLASLEILTAPAQEGTVPDSGDSPAESAPDGPVALATEPHPQYVDLLETLARWRVTIGRGAESLLAPVPGQAPSAVTDAYAQLMSMRADALVPSEGNDAASRISDVVGELPEREQEIFRQRVFATAPMTLSDMGEGYGVSRERVRQLEARAVGMLRAAIDGDDALANIALLLSSQPQGVQPLDVLLQEIPALGNVVATIGQPLWRVLDVLDDGYEIESGWFAAPSISAVRKQTLAALERSADDYGVVRLDAVRLPQSEQEIAWMEDWLDYLGVTVTGEYVLTRTSSVGDVAAAHLSIAGSPLTLDELYERVGRGVRRVLADRLTEDERFHRVSRSQYALRVWGLSEYVNIRTEIGRILDEHGGSVGLEYLASTVSERFDVARGSVTTYAATAPYQTVNGMVSRWTPSTSRTGLKPARTTGFYRRVSSWVLRVTVNHDHLRGSGFGVSKALCTITRLDPGESLSLRSRLGPQNVSFTGIQPAVGTIRRFLEDLGSEEGDEVFLVFHDDGSFDVEEVPPLSTQPLERALQLVGRASTLQGADALRALASAIKYPPRATVEQVVAGYRDRKEDDLADLIVQAHSDLAG